MKEQLDKVEYASLLYDFYGALLSDAQRDVTALYHEDNLSLSEIAEELGQSRQAVHYTLKKAEAALADYEDKLGLIASYEKNRELADKAERLLDKKDMNEADKAAVKDILEKLAE
jgi:hypothetical protein